MGNSDSKAKTQDDQTHIKSNISMIPMKQHNKMSVLLIYGYIRNIETSLSKIIPLEIYHLVENYYLSINLLFLLSTKVSYHHINTSSVPLEMNHSNTSQSSLSWKWKTDGLQWNNRWFINQCGICLKRNIKLPQQLTSSVTDSSKSDVLIHSVNRYYNGHCNIGSIDKTEFNLYTLNIVDIYSDFTSNNSNLPSTTYKLPSLSQISQIETILYSNKYGIISIGDNPNQFIYNLSFEDIDINKEWKWNQFAKMFETEKNCLYIGNASCILINNLNDDKEKLFMAGGGIECTDVMIFDLEIKQWNKCGNMKHETSNSGIYYDQLSQTIYIGGGGRGISGYPSLALSESNKMGRCVQVCELNKYNIWYELPSTQFVHGKNSLLWKEDNCMLYIASCTMNGIECLDLRINDQWKVVSYSNSRQKLYLSHLFGTEINAHYLEQYRLLQSHSI